MTNDKEERMLVVKDCSDCPHCKQRQIGRTWLMFCTNGEAWETLENWYVLPNWCPLPLVPHHTDEEIAKLKEKADAWDRHCELMAELQEYVGCVRTPGDFLISEQKRRKTVSELQARIKELTRLLESHGPEGHNVTNLQYTEMRDRIKELTVAYDLYFKGWTERGERIKALEAFEPKCHGWGHIKGDCIGCPHFDHCKGGYHDVEEFYRDDNCGNAEAKNVER